MLTVPVNPPTGVTVSVLVPLEPLVMVSVDGDHALWIAGAVTTCEIAVAVEALKPVLAVGV